MQKRSFSFSAFCLPCSQKRAQFFILTAVILSTLLFSLAFTVNEVVTIERENRFYDYSGAVEREAKNVIDYQVYKGFSTTKELDDFVLLLQNDFRDKAIQSNFMIIYGNTDSITIRNLGIDGVNITNAGGSDSRVLNGASDSLVSKIRIAGISSVNALNFRNDDTETMVYTTHYVDTVAESCALAYCEENPTECTSQSISDYNDLRIKSCINNEFNVDGGYTSASSGALTDLSGVFPSDEVKIIFDGHEHLFQITEANQVIFIIQRDVDNETFVDVR